MNKPEKTVWDFVQQYYPNYGKSQEIAENDDLQVLIDGEEEIGSHAYRLKQEIISDYSSKYPYNTYDEREAYRDDVSNEIEKRYNDSCKDIFEKAIEGYLEDRKTKSTFRVDMPMVIADVDQVMKDNDIDYPLTPHGKIEVLKDCRDNFDANATYWDNLLESVSRIINQSNGVKTTVQIMVDVDSEIEIGDIKGFKLFNKKGELEDTSLFIPTGWYGLVNHYGYVIKPQT